VYQGGFNDVITEKIVSLSEYNIKNRAELKKMRKKLSFIMVESFQNIIRHAPEVSENEDSGKPSSIFFVRNIKNTYFITSINLIDNVKAQILSGKLNHINSLDSEELKTLFIEILSDDNLSDKGGAGLGLIEMARKSGNNISYDFLKVSKEFSYCYLTFRLENADIDDDYIAELNIKENLKQFHKEILDNNILVFYKGDFSQESVIPVLKMIEDNMSKVAIDDVIKRKKTYNVLVEVLQNISRHSCLSHSSKPGLFMIGNDGDKSVIYAGNLINNDEVAALKNRLDNVKSQTHESLNIMYRDTLREGPKNNTGGAGLGLIDIARDSEGKFNFDFKKVDNDKSFYSICIKV
jgi:hypothetical protein